MNPDGGANLSALNCVASPGPQFSGLSKPLWRNAPCGPA
jgi:hypothetical protein